MIKKKCSTCRQEKTLDAFHKYKKGTHGRQGNCIACNKKQASLASWKKLGLDMDWDKHACLKKKQGGRCAICERTPRETGQKDRELAVDHKPGTTTVRALLCMDCNTAIGKLADDPNRIRKAADYVERY